MKITILTLFPELFSSYLDTSIVKRAIAKGLVEFERIDIRQFTLDKHRRVDDSPTGGGAGLIMRCQPILSALRSVDTDGAKILLTSPRGKTFSQEKALELSKEQHLVFIAGHYEGIDERVNAYADELISVGDFVLTGGELPIMLISDAVIRLIDGVISEASVREESFDQGLLEYPQYTLPYEFEGQKIPDILFSGNHEAIRRWRKKQALLLTREHRPDLFAKRTLSREEKKLLLEADSGVQPKWEKDALEKGKKFIKDSE